MSKPASSAVKKRPLWLDFRQRLEYLVFRIVCCLFLCLPWRTSVAVAKGAATFVSMLPKKLTRHHVAVANLERAFGDRYTVTERDAIVRGMWEHLFRMIAEIVQMPRKMNLYNLSDVTTYRNRDEATKTLCSGRPVLIIGGHFGNWEIAMRTFGLFGFPVGVVARDLDNPYLHRWFERFRMSTGHRVISKHGATSELPRYTEAGAHLGLLGDQDAGKRGMFVDFFGHPASTFKSIALMAMQYRAIILVGHATRLPERPGVDRWTRFEISAEAVIDPDNFTGADAARRITEEYTLAIEKAIRRAPEQYFWVHRRWKSEPKAKRQRIAA